MRAVKKRVTQRTIIYYLIKSMFNHFWFYVCHSNQYITHTHTV